MLVPKRATATLDLAQCALLVLHVAWEQALVSYICRCAAYICVHCRLPSPMTSTAMQGILNTVCKACTCLQNRTATNGQAKQAAESRRGDEIDCAVLIGRWGAACFASLQLKLNDELYLRRESALANVARRVMVHHKMQPIEPLPTYQSHSACYIAQSERQGQNQNSSQSAHFASLCFL